MEEGAKHTKGVSCCYEARLVSGCRRWESPDFLHQREAEWNVLTIGWIEQIVDPMGWNLVGL